MTARIDPPKLLCPECNVPLIEANARGRLDKSGEWIEHRAGCRCAWCDWAWHDDDEPTLCDCGALVGVCCDDGVASAEVLGVPCVACDGYGAPAELERREWVTLPGDQVARGWFHRDEAKCREISGATP